MKKILFIEFWNCTPHLETAFELAKKHLDGGDRVSFYFCGHDVLYKEGVVVSPEDCGLFRKLPEEQGAILIGLNKKNFHGRVSLPKIELEKLIEFEEINDLMNFKYKEFNVGLGVASSLVSNTKNSNPDLKKYKEIINEMIESGIQVFEFTKKIISIESPDVIYLFNGRFCNHRAVKSAAEELSIPIKYHERGANKNLYYLQSYMPHDATKWQHDMKKKWEEVKNQTSAKIIAESFFKDRRAGLEQSWTSFTDYQKRDLLPQIDSTKKIITYFSSSDDEFVAVGDIFKFEVWKNQFDALMDLIEICKTDSNIQLFIRVHPHLSYKSFEDQQRWIAIKNISGVNFISFDSEIDTYALIDESDVVVTAGSTVGIEATYWGKPSITLGPSHYSELNATYHPKSKSELSKLIHTMPKSLSKENTLIFGFNMATFGNEYKYYKADSLFKGKLLNVDLHLISEKRKIILRLKALILNKHNTLKKLTKKIIKLNKLFN